MLTGEAGDWADERNRVLALGLTHHEASLCSGCGMSLADTTGDEVRIQAADRHCRGCEALDEASSPSDRPGTQHFLEAVTPEQYANSRARHAALP